MLPVHSDCVMLGCEIFETDQLSLSKQRALHKQLRNCSISAMQTHRLQDRDGIHLRWHRHSLHFTAGLFSVTRKHLGRLLLSSACG